MTRTEKLAAAEWQELTPSEACLRKATYYAQAASDYLLDATVHVEDSGRDIDVGHLIAAGAPIELWLRQFSADAEIGGAQ
jgi:hypothetical protein